LKSLLPKTSALQNVTGDDWAGVFIRTLVNRTLRPVFVAVRPDMVGLLTEMQSKTTLLEFLIAPTQFAATYFNVQGGWSDILGGHQSLKRCNEWLHTLDKVLYASKGLTSKGQNFDIETYVLMRSGIVTDRSRAWHRIIGGFLQLVFGASFIFLGLNSLHFFDNDVKPVLDALTCMEIGLVYFLWLMWKTWTESNIYSKQALNLANALLVQGDDDKVSGSLLSLLLTSTEKESADIIFDSIMALSDIDREEGNECAYVPGWRQSNSAFLHDRKSFIENEFLSIKRQVDKISNAAFKGNSASFISSLNRRSIQQSRKAYLDFFYLLLNYIAGYGYMLGCLAFYFPENNSTISPGFLKMCRFAMFGLSHSRADWWGNLAGDFAWTVEPFTVLLVSYLVKERATGKPEKVTSKMEKSGSDGQKVGKVGSAGDERNTKKKRKSTK